MHVGFAGEVPGTLIVIQAAPMAIEARRDGHPVGLLACPTALDGARGGEAALASDRADARGTVRSRHEPPGLDRAAGRSNQGERLSGAR